MFILFGNFLVKLILFKVFKVLGLILNMMLELVVVKILLFKVNMELNVLLKGILFI